MKKKFKALLIALFAFFAFTLSGCTTSFCSKEDVENIKTELRWVLDNDPSRLPSDYVPTAESLEKAGVSELLKTSYSITVPEGDAYNWEYLGTLNEEQSEAAKTTYVDFVYNKYHPKACLVTEDHPDSVTGATISGKDFKFALKSGLLEIIAWPVSWLFVKGAELIGGQDFNGWAICISIIVVTFIIRGIIMLCTLKSSKQQQKMQEIQGEVNAINAKYAGKNDPDSKNRRAMETMNLYKKHGIKPGASLLQPFLTLPIFIAVYSAVKDTTLIFEKEIAGLSLGANMGNAILAGKWFAIILFIVMCGTQFLTMKLPQWKAKKKLKPYQRQNNNQQDPGNFMSYFFLIMIVIIAVMLPVAMSIYWVASSAFSIFQTLILNNNKK